MSSTAAWYRRTPYRWSARLDACSDCTETRRGQQGDNGPHARTAGRQSPAASAVGSTPPGIVPRCHNDQEMPAGSNHAEALFNSQKLVNCVQLQNRNSAQGVRLIGTPIFHCLPTSRTISRNFFVPIQNYQSNPSIKIVSIGKPSNAPMSIWRSFGRIAFGPRPTTPTGWLPDPTTAVASAPPALISGDATVG